jgi:thioredoxin reductase (NADPH)
MGDRNVIILGSGPAGLTAAVYTARADLKPLVVAGRQAGGQLMLTSEVENFPGFPEGIMGPELMDRMRQQAERFGAEFIDEDAIEVDFRGRPLAVMTEGDRFESRAVIIATGASARWIGLPSESRLMGRGVSSCATCDGFFFRNKDIAVVGGGDTALEEAIFLTKFASSVTVVHRRHELRASKIMQDRALNHPKIKFIWDSHVVDILGSDRVKGVIIENLKSRDTSELTIEGLFVAIGYTPNTEIFRDQIDLDERGYVRLVDRTKTNVPGVFVAGDVEDYHYRQAITAAGDGCRAAMDVEVFLQGDD